MYSMVLLALVLVTQQHSTGPDLWLANSTAIFTVCNSNTMYHNNYVLFVWHTIGIVRRRPWWWHLHPNNTRFNKSRIESNSEPVGIQYGFFQYQTQPGVESLRLEDKRTDIARLVDSQDGPESAHNRVKIKRALNRDVDIYEDRQTNQAGRHAVEFVPRIKGKVPKIIEMETVESKIQTSWKGNGKIGTKILGCSSFARQEHGHCRPGTYDGILPLLGDSAVSQQRTVYSAGR